MGVVKRFFKVLEENKKKQILFFCISMCVLFGLYTGSMLLVQNQYEIVQDDYSWVYQIDSMEERNGEIQIIGWAFALNQDAKAENYEIILQDVVTGKYIYPRMTYALREDVNEYFLCEYDYNESGFVAFLSSNELEGNIYEILLHPSDKRKAYATGIYFSEGEMLFAHPNEFVAPNVGASDLKNVVEEGILRVYRPDYGVYVYQYDGELYWIVDREYSAFENGDCTVEYQLNTTQIDKLPKERVDNGWYWSNLAYLFTSNEIVGLNLEQYRVAKCEIPQEYSVTDIHTGNSYSGGVWAEDFRPWYEFD